LFQWSFPSNHKCFLPCPSRTPHLHPLSRSSSNLSLLDHLGCQCLLRPHHLLLVLCLLLLAKTYHCYRSLHLHQDLTSSTLTIMRILLSWSFNSSILSVTIDFLQSLLHIHLLQKCYD
jgi:hypothetical protein